MQECREACNDRECEPVRHINEMVDEEMLCYNFRMVILRMK